MSAPAPDFVYRAVVAHVVDGDTLDLDVDLGFRITNRVRVRLADFDAPEVSSELGREIRDGLRIALSNAEVVVRTRRAPGDKYGRWLGEVWIRGGLDLRDVIRNEWLQRAAGENE